MIVIGVDVHKQSLTAVAVDEVGRAVADLTAGTSGELVAWSGSLDPKRLPREVFARAPATLATRHASLLAAVSVGPFTPGMVLEGARTERREL